MAQPATTPKIEELRFRIKIDPKSRLFYPLAEELRKVGQTGEAEHVLRTGLEHHPTYLSAWVSLGRVLRDQKNDAAAVEPLTKALQLDPGNVVAARLLADAYLTTGEKLEALKKYKLVHALMPGDDDLNGVIAQLERDLNPPAPAQLSELEAEQKPERLGDETSPIAPDLAPFAESDPRVARTSVRAPGDSEPEATEARTEVRATPGDAAEHIEHDLAPFAEEQRVEEATGDAEPMLAAHDESPFEEPAPDYTSATMDIEAPQGMHIGRAPLAADVAMDTEAAELPSIDAPPIEVPSAASDMADVFAPSADDPFAIASEPEASAPAEDFTNTITMADLYARQGLVADARMIYENILLRDPGNDAVRAKLTALDAPAAAAGRDPRVVRLEAWLAKVGRREVSGV
jgi:tetratricopeptide (TPR) repeat protein